MTAEPAWLITKVMDNGVGVPEEDLGKIFNVYYRNPAAHGRGISKSSGIGLAISKYLVELHSVKIWVESNLGEGSVFYFSLPIGEGNEGLGN